MDDDDECDETGVDMDTGDLLEELQRAADQHQRILERQTELIKCLREELKGVNR